MEPFFADFDLAQLSLYLFWAFFVGLVIYLQRENNREGFPLETESGEISSNQGMPSNPQESKIFKLPHGRGDAVVPDHDRDKRKLALELGAFKIKAQSFENPSRAIRNLTKLSEL